MTRNEIITRLCILTTYVGGVFNEEFAHDCWCEDDPNFKFDEKIIEFIEDKVKGII